MALCAKCKTEVDSLTTRTRKVNADLHEVNTTYWSEMSKALTVISDVLVSHGFALPEEGQVLNFRMHVEVGDGKWLSVSFHRMESGRYEVVAYVN